VWWDPTRIRVPRGRSMHLVYDQTRITAVCVDLNRKPYTWLCSCAQLFRSDFARSTQTAVLHVLSHCIPCTDRMWSLHGHPSNVVSYKRLQLCWVTQIWGDNSFLYLGISVIRNFSWYIWEHAAAVHVLRQERICIQVLQLPYYKNKITETWKRAQCCAAHVHWMISTFL